MRAVTRVCHDVDEIGADTKDTIGSPRAVAYLIFSMEGPRDIAACTHLLFIGKGMDQIGTRPAGYSERS